jgi:hypothetical protein
LVFWLMMISRRWRSCQSDGRRGQALEYCNIPNCKCVRDYNYCHDYSKDECVPGPYNMLVSRVCIVVTHLSMYLSVLPHLSGQSAFLPIAIVRLYIPRF